MAESKKKAATKKSAKKAAKKSAKKATQKVAKKTSKKAAKKAAKKGTRKKTAKKVGKKAARQAGTVSSSSRMPASPSQIREGAYFLYLRRIANGTPGDPLSDWLEAERILAAKFS